MKKLWIIWYDDSILDLGEPTPSVDMD